MNKFLVSEEAYKEFKAFLDENEVEKYMTSEGFEPDEVKEYSAVDVYFDSKERDRVIVEVRAELSYDGLFELGLRLDKIVAKYDEDAYFEPEESFLLETAQYNSAVSFKPPRIVSSEPINKEGFDIVTTGLVLSTETFIDFVVCFPALSYTS